ncbi:prepilin peptidase [Treponema sp.]|uniref:prepilin peptidase n=1 Tax=Treponema sp. TaxID=166 RepID=UPI00298E285A|nr:prepilin peptidase [Treponema sp.]MCR5614004.1 prepilin peptidase [Treponema sp.]
MEIRFLFLFWFCFIAGIVDLFTYRIPDLLNLAFLIVMLAFDFIVFKKIDFFHLGGVVILLCILFLIYFFCGGLGMGDIKMSFILAYCLGFFKSVMTLLTASILGLCSILFIQKLRGVKVRKIPFAPFIFAAVLILSNVPGFSEEADTEAGKEKIVMDFRNQNISDIIYSIADLFSESVFVDETVEGKISFRLSENDFEHALKRLSDYAVLNYERKDGAYYISKVKIDYLNDELDIEAENINADVLFEILSKKTFTTIIYEKIPPVKITLRCRGLKLEEVLNIALVKLNGFVLERVGSGFYISKNAGAVKHNFDSYVLSKNITDEKTIFYSLKLKKANLYSVLDDLFKKAGFEYSIVNAKASVLENLYFENKSFEQILRLVLQYANCDYKIENDIYYIFEIQKKDILKKFKDTKIIQLENISTDVFLNLVPPELNSSLFVKIDRTSNTVYLTGSEEEILPIENFIKLLDVPVYERYYEKFTLKNIMVNEAVKLIPKNILLSEPIIIEGCNSFILQVTDLKKRELLSFIQLIDKKEEIYSVKLKFIKSDELLKFIPPDIKKENITETGDSSLVFFSGTEASYKKFLLCLEQIDKPKQQVRYQILVIQHQKTNGMNWSSSLNISPSTDAPNIKHSVSLQSLLNINFDIISKFGLQFALNLNAELSSGKSHVLADTTLNGISGESILFSNTNTYRYRDVVRDSKDVYTSTSREISSGLTLSINGWVSGDDMITVSINAAVSKQGTAESKSSDTSNPPSTSEKKITTNVRTKSGEPVVIGGLLQKEKDVTLKRVPVLGYIPVIRWLFMSMVESVADTELVIYLVPFVEKNYQVLSPEKNIERLYKKYFLFEKEIL